MKKVMLIAFLIGTLLVQETMVVLAEENRVANNNGQGSNEVRQETEYDQNDQNGKISFTRQKIDETTLNEYKLQDLYSPYQIFSGSVIPGIMITGMNSDLPGQIVGQVSQNVYDSVTGRYLLIPQGTKILGNYDSKVTYGQERILVVWNRLIFPNGKSITIGNMQGTDISGYAGFKDKVNSHYGRVIWSVILGSVFTAGAAAVTGRNSNDILFKDSAKATAAANAANIASSVVNKNLNVQPTLMIRPGYQFNIMLSKDLVLEPYME